MTTTANTMRVNARAGLRLRRGPGIEYPSLRTLPLATLVYPLGKVDGWTLVDLKGDGAADGFVSSEFLTEAGDQSPDSGADYLQQIADAQRIGELIALGSSASGLSRARSTATREFTRSGIDPYPKNGCAAHLSALLQMAGINVRMTYGAGSLARALLKRGWNEVAVGAQRAGDIGVTYDRDPSPAGADHVYLVIQSIDGDEMLIADNQWKKDEPHTRYASGQGKTETEFFLRAL